MKFLNITTPCSKKFSFCPFLFTIAKMTSQIENFFVEVEMLIELQLRDKVQNQLEINQKFKEGKKLIDELEEDDEEQFGIFRYKYHAKYATYLKTVGEVDNASKQ